MRWKWRLVLAMVVCLPAAARPEYVPPPVGEAVVEAKQPGSDVKFVIPETVLPLWKGLSLFKLEESEESVVTLEGGSFSTPRHLADASPRLGPVKPHLHFTPGSPFSVVGGITVFF